MKSSYKKIVIVLAVILVVGIAACLIYLNLNKSRNENQNPTDILDEENDMALEGHLYKIENGYGLMGWDVLGDIDFEPYIDKKIVVVGRKGEEPYSIIANEIIEVEDDTNVKTKATVLYGTLLETDNQSSSDRHYKIGSFDIRSDRDLSEYVGKEVAVLVNEIVANNMTVRNGDLVDIGIPYIIEGTLEVVSKKSGHYHYRLGEYDVCSTMNISRYEGDYLRLLVFDGQHGTKEQKKVTLVKVK